MARPKSLYPAYRLHKPSGKAIVTLGDRMVYLGEHGTESSRAEYDRVVREWVAQGRPTVMRDPGTGAGTTIKELVLCYWNHVESYYVKDGKPTDEQACIKTALRPVLDLYGVSAVADFTPLALKACREQMIAAGWCRRHINKQICRVRQMFKWAVSEGLAPVTVWQALQSLEGLKHGRTEAAEKAPIQPVDDTTVDVTLLELDPTLQAMIRLQRLTGMRPQEVCGLTPAQIDRSADVWLYRPTRHKNQHHSKGRVVAIGPKAQEILMPYLLRGETEHCFQPRRSHRDHYTPEAYRERIQKACKRAYPAPEGLTDVERAEWDRAHRWAPNQLRHSAGTEIRAKYGLEGAQVVLGHSKANTTEIYAERDLRLAVQIAKEVG